MQISLGQGRLVASFFLALLCLVTQPQAFARTQDANFIRLNSTVSADVPRRVSGDLLLATDGNIYFTSTTGGLGEGFVGKLATDGTISTLHAFATTGGAGQEPFDGVIQANDGNLYGTTFLGGVQGGGTVFRLTLAGELTLLRSLGASSKDASLPYTGVVQASDNNLYGTTLRGGDNDKGTIFRISLDGSNFAILHHFTGADGENPEGRLIVGTNGELYGTTLQGGPANRGTIYRISVGGIFNSMYSFPALSAFNSIGIAVNATGANPRAGLLLAADGNYYGTTYQGGPGGNGTVFAMTPAGVVSVFHAFTGPPLDGGSPLAGVVQDAAGNFYGTSQTGGYLDLGSAWRISSSGQFRLLHGFVESPIDVANPRTGLLLANGGAYGGAYTESAGTLFKLDLGTNGVLPIELSVSPEELTCVSAVAGECGVSATITWSSPTAASCTATGDWTNGATTTSGTQTRTLTVAANYHYALSCTDGAGVVRNAFTALAVKAPPLQSVDGGGGAGALSVPLLLLLAALLSRKYLREIFTACP
ncbi:MAG: choice-of-anchor tandem repeat GloVer-containing protein [Steroidobacteraceae bacterium]